MDERLKDFGESANGTQTFAQLDAEFPKKSKCPNCGRNRHNDDANFCEDCGTKLTQAD
ncbi:hypothetical protein AGMMS49975_27030 [Clostridia bacterium]|nr:hypothetical protein AGMMS49975_27030 [Clostridia bacterium]